MTAPYGARIARVQKKMKSVNGCMLLSSAPLVMRNRDTAYPYRQNSDFYYLTGCTERDYSLLVLPSQKAPILLAPKFDSLRAVWEGVGETAEQASKRLGAECVATNDALVEVLSRINGCSVFYYQNIPGTLSEKTERALQAPPAHARKDIPSTFELVDSVLTPLRLHKDAEEIRLIKKAIAVTEAALQEVLPYIAPGVPERFLQATFDYWVRVYGGDLAFTTIVGVGPSAAILHYEQGGRSAREGDLILIDCGAEYGSYASDITRVFPVSGYFQDPYSELYSIVLQAQKAAIKKVKPGVKAGVLYDAAAWVLTEGLVHLGVLHGKASKLFAEKAYLPYFPHGIGHTLGIDVHDVGNLRGNREAVLEEGMVITIEPGLYFRRKAGRLPACGVRIEDDVLVTKTGGQVLTSFPKEIKDVEDFMMSEGELEVVL